MGIGDFKERWAPPPEFVDPAYDGLDHAPEEIAFAEEIIHLVEVILPKVASRQWRIERPAAETIQVVDPQDGRVVLVTEKRIYDYAEERFREIQKRDQESRAVSN